jgi:hypothetical protein
MTKEKHRKDFFFYSIVDFFFSFILSNDRSNRSSMQKKVEFIDVPHTPLFRNRMSDADEWTYEDFVDRYAKYKRKSNVQDPRKRNKSSRLIIYSPNSLIQPHYSAKDRPKSKIRLPIKDGFDRKDITVDPTIRKIRDFCRVPESALIDLTREDEDATFALCLYLCLGLITWKVWRVFQTRSQVGKTRAR